MLRMQEIISRSFQKFIFFGVINTILSNSLLLLLLSILPIGISTFLSQIFHAFLGYISNKYGAFKRQGNTSSYFILVILSWLIQWILLKIIMYYGVQKEFAILFIIPIIAIISFTIQKSIIFK